MKERKAGMKKIQIGENTPKEQTTGSATGGSVRKASAAFRIRDNWLFALFFCAVMAYYVWRLFRIPPWYDELYTYENFIDRGVIYSMIHWPLPNNHVLYSALSALLNKLGSPYLGLRGVSLLASAGSLLLLYRLLKKLVSPALSVTGCALFAAMYNVTQQAAQGRGYALSGFFLIAAANLLYEICVPRTSGTDDCVFGDPGADEGRLPGADALSGRDATENDGQGSRSLSSHGTTGRGIRSFWKCRRFWLYAGFASCLTGGLYAIPSNLYWVVSICFAGGLFLLLYREYGRLIRLIVASACAAVVTFGLYTIIWLAIGSNFLVKEEGGPFYGMSHFQMLFSDPAAAFVRGLNAMLSDPNIQSVDRAEFLEGIGGYLLRVLGQVYSGESQVLAVLVPLCLLVLFVLTLSAFRRKERSFAFCGLYCLVLTVMVPIFLFVQCVFPYLRVFTYIGSVLAMLFVLTAWGAVYSLTGHIPALKKSGRREPAGSPGFGKRELCSAVAAAVSILFMAAAFCSDGYNAGYDSRDNHIYAALSSLDETQVDTILTGDVYASQNVYFHITRCRGKELTVDEAQPDYVLLDKVQTGPEGTGLVWPYERDTEDFPWEWINEHMEVVYEDDMYIAYQVKE